MLYYEVIKLRDRGEKMNSSNYAMYEQIKFDIIDKIKSEFYKDNDKIPSENEIKKLYSVSRITASKALTELSLDGYIYRIQGKGSYVMPFNKRPYKNSNNTTPGNLNSKPKKIGFIIPTFTDYHAHNIIDAVISNLPFPDFFVNMIICNSVNIEDFSLRYFQQNNFAGIIMFPNDYEFYNETILEMHLNKFPVVLIDRIFSGINCNYVKCNNSEGARLATEYLINHGHTKICFATFSSLTEQTTSKRYDEFINTLIDHNLPISHDINTAIDIKPHSNFDKIFIDNIILGKISAAIAGNTGTTKYIYQLCLNNNIRIPTDFSLISFDNPEILKDNATFFTYVEQNSFDIGKYAAEIIKNILNNNCEQNTQLVLQPKLIINSSTRAL